MGSVAKSYIRKSFQICEEMRKYLVTYEEAVSHILFCNRSRLNFLICEEKYIFFFISVHTFVVYDCKLFPITSAHTLYCLLGTK